MRLHFKESGNGEPLVVLHGLFGSSDNWMGVVPKLAEHFRVFVLDLRNHGQSPHSDEMDYPLMSGDLADFLDSHQLTDAALMGHSLGGKIAMQFALSHPNRVRKLIISDMAPRAYDASHTKIISALLALDLGVFSSRQPVEEALATEIPSLAIRRFLLKNLGRDDNSKLLWKINLLGIAENYSKLGQAISSPTPFSKPVLFVRGGKSKFITESDEPLIRRLFPNAVIQTIEGAAHWVHADKPEEFAERVLRFLETD